MDISDFSQVSSILEPFVNTKVIVLKDLIGKLFPATDKVHKIFNTVLNQVAKKLDEKHNINHSKSLLFENIEKIKRSLLPYGHTDNLEENLADDIEFDTLPESYYNDFNSLLLERLLVYKETRAIVVEYLQALQIDTIHTLSQGVPRIEQSVHQILKMLEEQGQDAQFSSKIYTPTTPYFIQRRLFASSENLASDGNLTLNQIVETADHKRVTLINFAGNGKSVELEQLACWASSEESYYEPLLIKLGTIDFNSQTLAEYLNGFAPGWITLQGNLLLILDALDEVNPGTQDIVKKQIISLSEQLPECTIVVSSRTNAYQLNRVDDTGYLSGFTHFELPPFSDHDVWQYLLARFDDNQIAQQILNQASERGFRHDITTPFYLVRLCDYYSSNQTLPESKFALFEYLIEELKNKEKIKSAHLRDEIEEKESILDYTISKISVTLQLTGEPFLKSKDFRKIVDDSKLIPLVKQCYLLDSGAESKWRFEHNNFKEYLAAKHLAGLSFSKVKKVLFIPQLNKINPNWLNTLGFLMSYLNKSSSLLSKLIKHIQKHDPESLVRIEQDKVDLAIRENLFFEFLKEAKQYGTYPDKQKFSAADLGKSVSESKKVCEYLIKQTDEANEKVFIDLCSYLLRFNDNQEIYKGEIQDKLHKILQSTRTSYEMKENAISALHWFNIYSHGLNQFLIHELEMPEKEKTKALYYYYLHTDHVEDHIEVIIDGFLQEGHSDAFGYEVLDQIKKEESFVIIIDKLSEDNTKDQEDLLAILIKELTDRSLFSSFINNALYKAGKAHYGFQHHKDLATKFHKYLQKGELNDIFFDLAFEDYATNNNQFALDLLPLIIQNKHIEKILDRIQLDKWNSDRILHLRNVLSWTDNREVFDDFYNRLNEIYTNKFSWGDTKNPYQEALEKKIELLFNKDNFLKLSTEFFQSGTTDRKGLYKNTAKIIDNLSLRACQDVLSNILSQEPWTYSDLLSYIQQENNWEAVQARTLHSLVNNTIKVINDREEQFLKSWAKRVVENFEYNNFFSFSEENRHWYLEDINIMYAIGICEFYQLQLSRNTYENLILLDCHTIKYLTSHTLNQQTSRDLKETRLIRFITDALGEKAVEMKIVENLSSNKLLYSDVRRNHLKFLRKRKKRQYRELFLRDLTSPLSYQYLEWYLELDGDVQNVFSLFNQFERHGRNNLIEAIIKVNKHFLRDYLYDNILREKNKDYQETLISQLLRCEDERGIDLLKNWIIENKRFTGDSSILRAYEIAGSSILPTLKEIYQDSLEQGYGHDRAMFDRRSCLDCIKEIALTSKANFDEIYGFLTNMLENHPEMKGLYGVLDQLEFQFYSQQNHTFSLDEALQLVS